MTIESGDFAHLRWRVRRDVAVVETARSVVALALDSERPAPLALEGSASTIWQSIDGERDSGEIAVAVAVVYDTDVSVVLGELTEFLPELEKVGLIERYR
jgi:hypothetical protein